MKLEFYRQIFGRVSSIKFYLNLSGGSRVVPCGRTDGWTDGQTDMTKLIIAFCNFMNAPESSPRRPRHMQECYLVTEL